MISTINRRPVLGSLTTDELRELAELFEVGGEEATREELLDLLADTKAATLGQMLVALPRRRLKELCRARGLDDSGREKALLATRLLDVDPTEAPPPKAVPPIRRRRPRDDGD